MDEVKPAVEQTVPETAIPAVPAEPSGAEEKAADSAE
jgi:hypothetical protein